MFHVLPVLILASVDPSISLSKPKPSPTPFQDWDYLVYSQRWPITACAQWEEKGSKNTCFLPKDPPAWVVHGVWPSKIGAKGPFFCNSALHFDPAQLQPMMPQLQQFWPNVEANTQATSLWKHEWGKHGTCASTLPQLNSVTNYFKMGLQWNQQYKLGDMLDHFNITPSGEGYNVTDIVNSVKATTGKNPSIECVVDGKTKESLISEIRICFNKTLEVIDCNAFPTWGDDILINCNAKKDVMYFAKVPNSTESYMEKCRARTYSFQSVLWEIYDLVKFLMWFTL